MKGAPQTPIRARPCENARKQLAHSLRAGDGVELVAALEQPRRGIEVVIGTQRHDENVRLVNATIGGHATSIGVDRGDRLAQEAHPGLRDLPVREAYGVERGSTEHHIEL